MIIDIARMNTEGEDYEGDIPAAVLDLPPGDRITPESPIYYNVHAVLIGDELLVNGSLFMNVNFICSRCSENFSMKITVESFYYTRNIKEINKNTGNSGHKSGKYSNLSEFVDLTEDMRESILLAFPAHPVCNTGCKGLCPQCGINRNKESCECKPPSDSRWDLLDNFISYKE